MLRKVGTQFFESIKSNKMDWDHAGSEVRQGFANVLNDISNSFYGNLFMPPRLQLKTHKCTSIYWNPMWNPVWRV